MVVVDAVVLGGQEGLGLILIFCEEEEGGRCGIWLLYVSVVVVVWVSSVCFWFGGGFLDV